MTAASGTTAVVSFKDDAGTPAYQVVSGLRTRSIRFNAETVDVTNADSTGAWRELLAATGVKSAVISGDGIFQDDAGAEAMRDAFFDGTLRDAKILLTALGTFDGKFKISQLEFGADYNGAVTFSCTLESAGVITFTLV